MKSLFVLLILLFPSVSFAQTTFYPGETKPGLEAGSYTIICKSQNQDTNVNILVEGSDNAEQWPDKKDAPFSFVMQGIGPSGGNVVIREKTEFYRISFESISGPPSGISCELME